MNYPEEKQLYMEGVACQYLCHIEMPKNRGNVFPAHYHYYIEMLYALSGQFQIYLNGIYHEFAKGDFVLINSREVHKIDAVSDNGGSYIVVRFLPELIYDGMSQSHFELKYLLPFVTDNLIHEKVITQVTLKDTMIPELMQSIIQESAQKNYGYELAIKNHIGRIYLWLLRYWHTHEETSLPLDFEDRKLKEQLTPALTYMLSHYDSAITATDMAALCNLSYSYFSRSFHRLMHVTFSEYLNDIRLREAEKLLVSTSQSITEISQAVGFCTTSYFIKLFKEHMHMSPKQYQKHFNSYTE